jgi:hypothetical protein
MTLISPTDLLESPFECSELRLNRQIQQVVHIQVHVFLPVVSGHWNCRAALFEVYCAIFSKELLQIRDH